MREPRGSEPHTVAMDTAQIALVLSSALAVWELAKYLLEGGRVRVRLRPGRLEEYALSEAKTWQSLEKSTEGQGGWPVEVAILDVDNLGRTPVTISNPSLDLALAATGATLRRSHAAQGPACQHAAARPAGTLRQRAVRLRHLAGAGAGPVEQHPGPASPGAWAGAGGGEAMAPSITMAPGLAREARSVVVHVERGGDRARGLPSHVAADARRPDGARCLHPVRPSLAVRARSPTPGPGPTKDELLTLMDEHHYGEEPHKAMLFMASLYAERDLAPFYTGQVPTEPTQG